MLNVLYIFLLYLQCPACNSDYRFYFSIVDDRICYVRLYSIAKKFDVLAILCILRSKL